jgi:PPK2 family polyphosphate:nucleotide phosphotransferase
MAKPRSMTDVLRAPAGDVDVGSIDPRATPAAKGGKAEATKVQAKLAERMAELQEKLFAEGRTGGSRSLLLVLQGMDTSGKGGTIKHVIGQVDPQGTQITAFKAPSSEERKHDFLWRIKRRLPAPGIIGVFDRSQYEEVLVARVRGLAPRSTWSRRYGTINRFEEQLVAGGTTIIKCFLHISFDEWRERQLARLDDPTKHWKFNPGDLDDGALWDDYMDAYNEALNRCSTDAAPWYVIPADRKWHRNIAVTRLLLEHLEGLDLTWPTAKFEIAEQRERINELARERSDRGA